jgi:RNA polymerase sigma-70 factor (ECF subfamily)
MNARVAILLAQVDGNIRVQLERLDNLEQTVDAHVAAAHASWPNLRVSDQRFMEYLAQRLSPERIASFSQLPAADLYIVCACLDGDTRAIQAFEAHYFTAVAALVGSLRGNSTDVDEVKQLLRHQLFASGPAGVLAGYSGAGSLRGWLRSVILRTTMRLMRSRQKAVLADEDYFLNLVAIDDPELAHMRDVYRRELNAALKDSLLALSTRQRNLLRQQFIDGLSVDQLGRLYHVSRATAARWAAAARAALMETTRQQLMARLRVTETELQSIVRFVISQLEVSLDHFPSSGSL